MSEPELFVTSMPLTERQKATVHAALEFWKRRYLAVAARPPIYAEALSTGNRSFKALSIEEVDELIEGLSV